jgi:hypothetical protein
MRYAFLGLFGLASVAFGAYGCGPPKMPTGPAPEYEDPPPPSWLKDAGSEAAAPELS